VYFSTIPGGPYTLFGVSADKSTSQMEVTGLDPVTTYYFVVQTWTDPHVSNQNTVESNYSIEVVGTTNNVTDSDNDGIPDDYELSQGFDPYNPLDAFDDPDGDGYSNLDEYNLGTDPHNPDTDGDGVDDAYDGSPLDDQQSICPSPVMNDLTLESFPTVQAAVDDFYAEDFDTIQITHRDFGEDVLFDRNLTLFLSGGYKCSHNDNPRTSFINSLTIRNGTIIVENLTIN